MAIDLTTPAPDELRAVLTALREWQVEGAPVQLHPGDLGWAWQVGPERLAGLVRTWSRHGRTLAVGFLDGPVVVRLAIAPEAGDDGSWRGRSPQTSATPTGACFLQVRVRSRRVSVPRSRVT